MKSLPLMSGPDAWSPTKRWLGYGVLLHFGGKSIGGTPGKYADLLSAAYLMRGAWSLGAAKFALEGDEGGYDEVDADEVAGVIEG